MVPHGSFGLLGAAEAPGGLGAFAPTCAWCSPLVGLILYIHSIARSSELRRVFLKGSRGLCCVLISHIAWAPMRETLIRKYEHAVHMLRGH